MTDKSAVDAVYHERNQVVAALAWMALKAGHRAGVAATDISGWEPEWRWCVYIDLPTGQVSWHFHELESNLFEHLPTYLGKWDGHDTQEKYRRCADLADPELYS